MSRTVDATKRGGVTVVVTVKENGEYLKWDEDPLLGVYARILGNLAELEGVHRTSRLNIMELTVYFDRLVTPQDIAEVKVAVKRVV